MEKSNSTQILKQKRGRNRHKISTSSINGNASSINGNTSSTTFNTSSNDAITSSPSKRIKYSERELKVENVDVESINIPRRVEIDVTNNDRNNHRDDDTNNDADNHGSILGRTNRHFSDVAYNIKVEVEDDHVSNVKKIVLLSNIFNIQLYFNV